MRTLQDLLDRFVRPQDMSRSLAARGWSRVNAYAWTKNGIHVATDCDTGKGIAAVAVVEDVALSLVYAEVLDVNALLEGSRGMSGQRIGMILKLWQYEDCDFYEAYFAAVEMRLMAREVDKRDGEAKGGDRGQA